MARTATVPFALPEDHPGSADAAYRARRAAIAEVGATYTAGAPIPDVEYTPAEDAVWRTVWSELQAKHQRYACREYRMGAQALQLPRERVPQLREVDDALRVLSDFRLRPVPGLVPTRTFYGALAQRTFLSTQYIRHHSAPFYTPEPDIVHEIVGHANTLANRRFADLYEAAGHASQRATTDAALEFFSRVFWFTLEFGVVMEQGEPRAYGAGLLSSFSEIELFRDAELRPFDLAAMGSLDYDITHYQPVLFVAASYGQMIDELGAFFASYDNATPARLTAPNRRRR